MPAATPANLRILAPDFAGLDDPTLQFYLDAAAPFASSNKLGTTIAGTAQMYLAAHTIAMARPGLTTSGQVTEVVAGPVSKRFGSSNVQQMKGTDLNLTRYGTEFRRILRAAGLGFAVTGCS